MGFLIKDFQTPNTVLNLIKKTAIKPVCVRIRTPVFFNFQSHFFWYQYQFRICFVHGHYPHFTLKLFLLRLISLSPINIVHLDLFSNCAFVYGQKWNVRSAGQTKLRRINIAKRELLGIEFWRIFVSATLLWNDFLRPIIWRLWRPKIDLWRPKHISNVWFNNPGGYKMEKWR